MAMRDLVTGSGNCDPSSSSNPLGSLVNTLVGSSSKTQERLKEIPTATSSGSNQFYPDPDNALALPGSETDFQLNQHPSGQDLGFLNNYRAATHGGFTEAWDDIQYGQRDANVPIYNERIVPQTQPSLDGPPQKILSSSHFGAPFRPFALPTLGLTKGEKQCIRNRSSIMARHSFADKSHDFISAQQIMSMKKERPPLPQLMTLNKGLKLAEQWVKKMSGELEEAEEIKEMEGRPSRLGLGAKVPHKPHVGPLNDPVERRLHKKLGVGRKKFDRDEDSTPPPKNEIHSGYEDEDEHLDSRTNAFNKKRAVPLSTTPQPKKKQK